MSSEDNGYLSTGLGIRGVVRTLGFIGNKNCPHIYNGVSFPSIVPVEGLKALENFETRPDDVIIVSYPKSGLNWTYEVVALILNNADIRKPKLPLFTHVPYLEVMHVEHGKTYAEILRDLPSPRLIATHLRYSMLPQGVHNNGTKIIYVARNPKDVVVSYYHFHRMSRVHPDPGAWDKFLSDFMSGNVVWGSWYQHVLDVWANRQKHNILIVRYEDMKKDFPAAIRLIAAFLGRQLTEPGVQLIASHCSFDSMKSNPMTNGSKVPMVFNNDKSHFLRKGVVGDWINHFTVAQDRAFDSHYLRTVAVRGMEFQFELL
ncbi:sulfotransferase 1A1-like [Branchiostoma floridae x Branchiostoma japonicum]